jgi:hypothetical protein
MNLPISGDTALVELQGENALGLIGADYHSAQYQLAGFAEVQVILTDHRQQGIMALQEWRASGDIQRFLRGFNTPAFFLFSQAGERGWMIDLYDTDEISPINTIHIGLNHPGLLPLHNYDFYHYEPDGVGGYHFLAIYQNDPELIPAFSLVPEYANF